jgi:putative alpha-1,2-mannosidase
MSAWLVFTTLGFYPVAPGSNQYVIGRPFVNRAKLNLPDGKSFTISAYNLSDSNGYVESVTLNGRPLARSYIRDEEIRGGGELHFVMGPTPNKRWATAKSARPYSMSSQ